VQERNDQFVRKHTDKPESVETRIENETKTRIGRERKMIRREEGFQEFLDFNLIL